MQSLYTTVVDWELNRLLVLVTTSTRLFSWSIHCREQTFLHRFHVKIFLVQRGTLWYTPYLVSVTFLCDMIMVS